MPYKGPFLQFCQALGINDSKNIPDAIDRMFRAGPVFDEVVFAALGHNYIFNPSPGKLIGLYQLFINVGPHNPEALELNIDGPTRTRARNCFFNPQASVKPEPNLLEDTQPGTSRPIAKSRKGGAGSLFVSSYTVADYNLCIQALDVLGAYLMQGDSVTGSAATFHKEILDQLNKGRGKQMSSASREDMVKCYNKLRVYWSDHELTGMGFKAR
jgi:hypothetical protein